MKLQYLITGTGRCGTVFMARLLTTLGIPCGHESVFDFEGLESAKAILNDVKDIKISDISQKKLNGYDLVPDDQWFVKDIVAESSYMAAPFLNDEILKETKIIHVVRNPIKVVSSFVNHIDYFAGPQPGVNFFNQRYEGFIYSHIPELTTPMTQYERACLYYIRWNEMIEKTNAFFHRIEDGIQPIVDFVGKDFLPSLPTDTNTLKKPGSKSFSLMDLPKSDIKDQFIAMGKRYGYPMTSNYLFI